MIFNTLHHSFYIFTPADSVLTTQTEPLKIFLLLLMLPAFPALLASQEEDRSWRIGLFAGMMNYQGDLQPTSFALQNTHPMFTGYLRKNITNRFSARFGLSIGQVSGYDSDNRDYLQQRNLSFKSGLQELFLSVDYTVLDLSSYRLSPFVYANASVFHFNPYTYDNRGQKIYLKPLSTEGQGLPGYPDRKPYKLVQPAIGFGGGLRYVVNQNAILNFYAGQNKSFTDYIDDVSKTYIDENKLLAARGRKAVELAFRGDEVHNPSAYPPDGEQRGTPTEMDWYYYVGVSLEVKLEAISNLAQNLFPARGDWYNRKCPSVY